MPPSPPPATEGPRLARLRALGVLDTLPERAYDDIAALEKIAGKERDLQSMARAVEPRLAATSVDPGGSAPSLQAGQ